MFKRVCLILLLLLTVSMATPIFISSQIDVSNMGVAGVLENSGKVVDGVKSNGFWNFIKDHYILVLSILLNVGFMIARFTPNKKDDAFFNKYIIVPARIITKFMSLGLATEKVPPGKK